MGPPPISLFLSTIASQPAFRQRQEYLLRSLQVRKIPFTSYDLASDEQAKKLWKRKAPPGKQELPGILVGNTWPGTFAQFEDAVEYGELDTFLRLKEEYDPVMDGRLPSLPVQQVGVPGAHSPAQITNQKPSFSATTSPLKQKGEVDIGERLGGFGLEGVTVTEEELADLVHSLGLDGEEADDLVKGLDFGPSKGKAPADTKASGGVSKLTPKPKASLPTTSATPPISAPEAAKIDKPPV
ncbi:hypothetical protein BOTBODRAFT_129713 [Botryobasidium botryosum FD-172 SS1]|uniref:Uncharacterized protein n=1 Tax=Botryobasidium botryosum (strain FD-172 SS1) TaxID=930990 RepID=A0A067MZ24_BOTB1|nr:hypothetical protein BOTBODRAFT_129713 [Botryobasidium botryosum FD-172 SS1]